MGASRESSTAGEGPPARPSRRHVAVLDGLRGIAILVVMLHHFEYLLPQGNIIGSLIRYIFYAGWAGVDLFFVLSGFLITGILIDTKESANYFSSFYARRILRIFPLYYAVLGLIVIVAHITYRPEFDRFMAKPSDQIYYFVYLNNWLILIKDTWHANIIGHFWSLAVEEQFYLLWPACVWVTPKSRLFRVALAGCVAALVLRIGLVAAHGPSIAIVVNTFTRMDTLLAGACCALVVRDESLIARVKPWLIPTMALTALGFVYIELFADQSRDAGPYMETIGFSLISFGCSALLLQIFLEKDRTSLSHRLFAAAPLTAMGKYSYGIYVFHVPILMLVTLFFGKALRLGIDPWTSIAVFLALIDLSFLAAHASYNLFEVRFLRLKNRFEPRFGFEASMGATRIPAEIQK